MPASRHRLGAYNSEREVWIFELSAHYGPRRKILAGWNNVGESGNSLSETCCNRLLTLGSWRLSAGHDRGLARPLHHPTARPIPRHHPHASAAGQRPWGLCRTCLADKSRCVPGQGRSESLFEIPRGPSGLTHCRVVIPRQPASPDFGLESHETLLSISTSVIGGEN